MKLLATAFLSLTLSGTALASMGGGGGVGGFGGGDFPYGDSGNPNYSSRKSDRLCVKTRHYVSKHHGAAQGHWTYRLQCRQTPSVR